VKIVRRADFDEERPYEREFAGIRKFEPISRSHEGFVDLLQVGRNDAEGYFYYVMELADRADPAASSGGSDVPIAPDQAEDGPPYQPRTLAAEVKARGVLPLSDCLRIAHTLTSAVAELHRNGLVHRDIKPSNIIFVNGVPKLADIGLVAGANEARSFVGTEGFIPPEGPGRAQADLYSLGMVLYVMSTRKGHRDFPEPPADLASRPDRECWLETQAIIYRACQIDPRLRYQTAEEMLADLARLLRGGSVRRVQRIERFWWLASRAAMWVAIGACVVSLIFLAARQRQPTAKPEASKHNTNDLAQNEFDIGQTFYRKTGDMEKAASHFRNALEADTNFTRAEGALATSLAWGSRDRFSYSFPHLSEAAAIAKHALRADPENSDALIVVALFAFVREWDWGKAEKHFQEAIRLDRLNFQSHEWRGLFLRSIGRTNEAIHELEVATSLNGSDETVNDLFGQVLHSARRYPEAIQKFRKALEMPEAEKPFMSREWAWSLFWEERSNEAIEKWLDAYYGDEAFVADLKHVLREQGQPTFWRKRLEILRARCTDPVILAEAAAMAGQIKDALDYLDQAYREHHDFLVWNLKTDPEWDSLRVHPRFKSLLKNLGLE
jgi:Tfp pilus assembly protein PilF